MDTYNRCVRVRRWVLAAVVADGLLLVQSHSLIAPPFFLNFWPLRFWLHGGYYFCREEWPIL